MKRYIDINEISDGRLYTSNDMVKADCQDCKECFECCQGMGTSIVLDPMDIWRMAAGTGMKFEDLMNGYIELNVVDGIILPNLKMGGENTCCAFLNDQKRCSIHPHRPGICRLFPLGRYYEDNGFRYFLQVHECRKQNRGKIKVKKWIGVGDIASYEAYITKWHDFLRRCEEAQSELNEEQIRILNLYVLKTFYQTPFSGGQDDNVFYLEFNKRMEQMSRQLGI